MAIVEIEIVMEDESIRPLADEQTRKIADRLAAVFETGPNRTWVRFRYLPRSHYAQNGDPEYLPAFVTILKNRPPYGDAMGKQMLAIARLLSDILRRPAESIHIVYEPSARGRFGIGGVLG